jgi:hypothetical protein
MPILITEFYPFSILVSYDQDVCHFIIPTMLIPIPDMLTPFECQSLSGPVKKTVVFQIMCLSKKRIQYHEIQ